jgi:hypothetical protein
MKLLTKAIEKKLPALYSTEAVPVERKKLIVKFFTPWAGWAWYAAEYDPAQRVFFGLVIGQATEWGYFSLAELEEVRGPCGLKIERDLYWGEKEASEVLNESNRQ